MAGWKNIARETEAQSVQSYLAAIHKENSKVSPTDLTIAIAGVGLSALSLLFIKKIGPQMGKLLGAVSTVLSVVSLTSLFLANPNSSKLQKVLDDCAKKKGTYILTTTELWEYVGYSGNNTTWETRTTYSYH